MIEARIRGLRLWLFSKFFWEMVLRKLISARIRRCRSCSKLFLSFHDSGTCPPCDVNDYMEFSKAHDRELRTMPYAEYLQTDHWQCIRFHTLERARFRCQLCNSPKRLEVHHRTYENLGHEKPEDLIVLCHKDHEHFHLGERNEC